MSSKAYNKKWRENHKEYRKEYGKKWRAANPEKVREHSRLAYIKHREKKLTQGRLWRQKNKERSAELSKKWRANNRERMKETKRLYRLKNRDAIRARHRRWSNKNRQKGLRMIGRGEIKCRNCQCDRMDLLEINHIYGGGYRELTRKSVCHNVVNGTRKIDDLELLCKVCNALHYLELKYGKLPFKVSWKSH